jgi:predicted DCC family thiol-disulfide oxidoreductase YuxK
MKVPQHLQRYLSGTFSIDLRTLALFRACLGAVLFVALLSRFCDLGAFHADAGVLPRALLMDDPLTWSVHFANGTAAFQGALLALQALAAFCLAIGYRARLAVFLSWFLLLSLHNRNPLVLVPGDDLMGWLLFWGMFLPLAARWSVDAALGAAPAPEQRVLSWASAGLVLQSLGIYVFGALLMDGIALPPPAHPGHVLLLALLALSPFWRRPLRFAVLALLLLMNLALVLRPDTGHLASVSLASLTVLLGGWWWDWLQRRRDHGRHLKVYYDGGCAFCLKSCLLLRHLLILPRTELLPAQGSSRAQALMQAQYTWVVIDGDDVAHTRWNAFVALLRHSLLLGWAWRLAALKLWERPGNALYDWVARNRGALGAIVRAQLPLRETRLGVPAWTRIPAAVVLVTVLTWNVSSVWPLPEAIDRALAPTLKVIRMDPSWGRFARNAGRSGWFVAPGQLADGTEVDALRPWRQGVDFSEPGRDARWQAYHARVSDDGTRRFQASYATYLCRRWNADAGAARRLARFRLTYMFEERHEGLAPSVEQRVLWHYDCIAHSPSANP